jgi:DNA-binding winged helix-turn-helix (wHTH) protein/tetratricopeptide (TPR) repeat protein
MVRADHDQIFEFGDFKFDPGNRDLTERGLQVAIQDKPLDLLLYLVIHRSRIVPRHELLREVWGGVTVGPQAVRFAVHALRAALRDDGKTQAYVRTFTGRGVQFVAPVASIGRSPSHRASEDSPTLPFLHRDNLHREIQAAVCSALKGDGQTLLLHGEPGIGKTRSLEHISALAESHGFRVARGHGVPDEQAPAYWPWVQALRESIAGASQESRASMIDDGAIQLASLIPELRAVTKAVDQGSLADSRSTRFLLFDGVSEFIKRVAMDTPVCILLDDLQFSDSATQQLFAHLASDLRNARVLLVGALRNADAQLEKRLAHILSVAASSDCCRVLELTALPPDSVKEFVFQLHKVVPSEVVSEYLFSRTNGNPFFLRQLLQVLDAENRLNVLSLDALPEIELPLQIRTAIARQIMGLPADTIRLLEVAAVAGKTFRAADIQRALGISSGKWLKQLDIVTAAGVLRSAGETSLSFAHVLVRDAIYSSLPIDERARLHREMALAIESDGSSGAPSRAAELAHHWSKTATILGVARAATYAEAAADLALAGAGFEEAASQLENAASLLEAAGQQRGESRCQVLVKLGEARIRSGDRDGALRSLREASAIATSGEFTHLAALAALRYAPDFLALETGVYDSEQVAILESSLITIGRSDDRLRAQLLARLAVALHWNDEAIARRTGLLDEASVLSQELGDEEISRFVETGKALANFSVAEPEDLLRSTTIVPGVGEPTTLLIRRLIRITALWLAGKLGEVRTEVEVFGAEARRLRQPQALWYETLLRATLALTEGQFQRAAVLGREFLRRGEHAGDKNAQHSFLLQSFMAGLDVGKIEAFESGIRSMIEAFPRVVGWRAGLLLFLAESGRIVEAAEVLDELVTNGALERPKRNEWYALIGALAIGIARTESPDHAERLYDLLSPHRDQLAVVGYGSYCWGSTEQLLGLCAAAAREYALAEEHLRKAIEANRGAGAMPALARAYGDLAVVLLRGGRKVEALDHGRRCIELAGRLGMARVAGRISDSLSL